jgi:hypothetical protein
VTRLRDDVAESRAQSSYYLQPIVVKRMADGRWELVDGQQRLTTLFLILQDIRSHWGVLTDCDGGKLPFLDQPALFGLLAGSCAGNLLGEGRSVFDGPPELVAEQLAIPSVQAWAREWFSSAGLAAPVDFGGLGAG